MTAYAPVWRSRGLATMLGLILLGAVPHALAAEAPPDRPSDKECAQVKDAGPIELKGRTLVETPDITEPELRRANALLSARCFEQAVAVWEAFAARNPDNYHVFFLQSRMDWISDRRPFGQLRLEGVLRAHPDFSSAKLLLASMRIEDQNFPAAAKLLDEVEKVHPDDLWAYIDRLRIEAALAPTPSTADTLVAIIRDPRFPPSARQQALETIQFETQGLTQAQRDRIFSSLTDEKAAMTDCALSSQAMDLMETRNDPREAAKLIESYIGKSRPCSASALVRTLLAEAYLSQAADIAPTPRRANASLVAKAKRALNGDLAPLAIRVASINQLDRLIPFIQGFVSPDAVDENGTSALCAAVRAYNVPMVREALREHASPDSNCSGYDKETVLKTMILTAAQAHVTERQEIARELLSHGARLEAGMANACQPGSGGDCAVVLLPILKEFEARRAAVRAIL